jgi:hypothetical protein
MMMAQQDRLRNGSLTIVASCTALIPTTQHSGQQDDQHSLKRLGQKHHLRGVDGKSLTELLGDTFHLFRNLFKTAQSQGLV